MRGEAGSQGVLEFEGFKLDVARRSLQRDGQALALGARAFDVLVVLVQHRDRVVGKDELLQRVWGARVVEEGNLAVQVNALRRLLGPGAIATVPGQGYRWTLATHAAPAAAASPATVELGLVGREPELAWLQQALAGGATRMTLVGPAGIGKTALARAWLAQQPTGRAAMVEMAAMPAEPAGAPADPSALAAAVLDAIGGSAQGAGPPLAQLAQALVRSRRNGSMPGLLVLDNAEHLPAAVRAVLAGLQSAAPMLPVLVTSQVPLQVAGERVLRVEPLPTPTGNRLEQVAASPAVVLLTARARLADPRFALGPANAAAMAELCRQLDGVPLALELAGARVPLLGAQGVLTRLSERWQLLRRAAPVGEARHQSLRAAIDWSWALLPPFEGRVLLRLASFSGSFGAAEAQQLAGDERHDGWAVLDALDALVQKSLVARAAAGTHEPRFMLLPTVAEYARMHPDAQTEAPAQAARHAQLYVTMAESVAPNVPLGDDGALTTLNHLTLAADNLRAALQWCLAHDVPLGLRLAAALYPWWRSLGHLAEGRAACAALLQRCADAPPSATRLAVMVYQGALAMEQDDAPAVQAIGSRVLADAQALGDRRRQAHAHGLLAHAAYSMNQLPAALQAFGLVLAYCRAEAPPVKVAEALNNLASCWLSHGQPQQALSLLHEALPLVQGQDRWTEAAVQQNLGEVLLALGRADDAAVPLQASLALQRDTGHQRLVVMGLLPLAMLELHRQRPQAARDALLEAVQACRRHGYGQQDALALALTGAWALHTGQVPAGARLLGHGAAALQGSPLAQQPHVRRLLDAGQALATAELGVERAAALRAAGGASSTDEAFALALGLLGGPGDGPGEKPGEGPGA